MEGLLDIDYDYDYGVLVSFWNGFWDLIAFTCWSRGAGMAGGFLFAGGEGLWSAR